MKLELAIWFWPCASSLFFLLVADAEARTLAIDEVTLLSNAPSSENSFGPGGCVKLQKSSVGTCLINTNCASRDISDVDFSFVCFNPGTALPHALHSFGRGGFANTESFDTGVKCTTCTSVDFALSNGGPLLRGTYNSKSIGTGNNGNTHQMKTSLEAAYFGPNACIATFPSQAGSCMIQTRCKGVDISRFTVGITCLDRAGDYTRYLFGANSFKPEETFDTLIRCASCIGVGDESAQQVRGLIPKNLVDDVTALKKEVKMLRGEMRAMKQNETNAFQGNSTEGANATNSTSDTSKLTEPLNDELANAPAPFAPGPAPLAAAPAPFPMTAEPANERPAPAPAPVPMTAESATETLASAPAPFAMVATPTASVPTLQAIEASAPAATISAALTVKDLLRRLRPK